MADPDLVMVAVVLAVLGVPLAGVTIFLAAARRREILLSPLMDLRRLRR